mgnify:CR=1 FL=1
MALSPSAPPKAPLKERRSYARIPEVLEVPNLLQIQLNSYRWLKEEGIKELLAEVSPIISNLGSKNPARSFLIRAFKTVQVRGKHRLDPSLLIPSISVFVKH